MLDGMTSRLRKNTIRKGHPKGSLSPTIGIAGFMSSLGTDPTGKERTVARIGTTQLMNAVSKRESGSRNEATH